MSTTSPEVLVTGATGYLGTAVVRELARGGWSVIANGRSPERLSRLTETLRDEGLEVSSACFDVCSEDAVSRFFSDRDGAPLRALVNNAYAGGGGTVETADAEDYRAAYEITVVAAQRLVRHALPGLRAARRLDGDASVVNIASMYGTVSPDPRVYRSPEGTNPPFYGAAKAGLIQWTRYAAVEFGPEGVRVNSVSPGPFPASAGDPGAQEFVALLADKVPLGRVGRAEEVARPVAFLASDDASFVTGANLAVDGGWTAW